MARPSASGGSVQKHEREGLAWAIPGQSTAGRETHLPRFSLCRSSGSRSRALARGASARQAPTEPHLLSKPA